MLNTRIQRSQHTPKIWIMEAPHLATTPPTGYYPDSIKNPQNSYMRRYLRFEHCKRTQTSKCIEAMLNQIRLGKCV